MIGLETECKIFRHRLLVNVKNMLHLRLCRLNDQKPKGFDRCFNAE